MKQKLIFSKPTEWALMPNQLKNLNNRTGKWFKR